MNTDLVSKQNISNFNYTSNFQQPLSSDNNSLNSFGNNLLYLPEKNPLGIKVNLSATFSKEGLYDSVSEFSILEKKDINNLFTSHKKTDEFETHKKSRKMAFKLKSLNKKYRLLAGKGSYSCGSVIGIRHVMVDSDKNKNSVMNNISHCNSVYQCLTCATKILSRRQLELEAIGRRHIENGGSALLVSLTCKHSKKDSFEDLLGSTGSKKGILFAYANLSKKYKARFKKLLDLYSVDFSVRVFESTWGSTNGFHAHIHSLFYLKRTLTEQEILDFKTGFYKLWKSSLKDVGYTCNFENGIDVQDGSDAGKYIAKWSGANELSSPHVKKAKNGNYTMFQLSKLLLDKDQTELPMDQVKAVLAKYYKGCYGKLFMTWSGNRKQKDAYLAEAKLQELSDEACVEESNIESKERILVGNSTFKEIYNQEKVHEFRTSFELGSFKGVLDFAKSISISTKDIHFVKDVDLTEEDKLKKIDYFKSEYGFFPEVNELFSDMRDYYVLNYENLINTAIDYYSDHSTLVKNNAYYPYVLEFCKQYAHLVLIQNS